MDLERAYNIIIEKIEDWVKDLVALLPNLVVACIILVLGLFVVRFLKKIFRKGIAKVVPFKNLANLLTNILNLILIAIVIFAALSVLKLDKTVTTLLAGAGVIGLALAFAFQDIAANFVSGVFLAINRPFRAGETIKSKDHTGVVDIVNMRDTVITNFQGQMVRIPNKEIFQNPIVNYTRLGKRRLDLDVGVSYSDDLEKVERVAIEAVKSVSVICRENEPKVFFREFGESSINFDMMIWFKEGDQPTFLKGRSETVKAIKKAFDENGITIPFPIRTLDFSMNNEKGPDTEN